MSTVRSWAAWGLLLCAACGSDADAGSPQRGSRGGAAAGALAGAAPVVTLPPGSTPDPGNGANAPATTLILPPAMAAPTTDGSCNQDVDVVFSLDVSGSMAPPLTKLANEVSRVDEALKTKNLPHPPHYGLVIFVDDFQVMNNGEPYADLEQLKSEINNQAMLLNADSSRQVMAGGTPNFSWPENSLDALYAAATQFKWRPITSTLRVVFHITDASFWDGMEVSSGNQSEIPAFGQPVSMHSYAQVIDALHMQHVWVNAFAAKTGGPPDGMMAPASHGQFRGISVNVGIGFFEPYKGMKAIPEATGGSAWDLDDVFDGKLSLGAPIQMSIEARQCAVYPG